jgi:hypothetical protein
VEVRHDPEPRHASFIGYPDVAARNDVHTRTGDRPLSATQPTRLWDKAPGPSGRPVTNPTRDTAVERVDQDA